MIIVGIFLIVLGLLLPSLVPTFAFAHVVLVLGFILLVVGLILTLMGRMGHAVGGPPPLLLGGRRCPAVYPARPPPAAEVLAAQPLSQRWGLDIDRQKGGNDGDY